MGRVGLKLPTFRACIKTLLIFGGLLAAVPIAAQDPDEGKVVDEIVVTGDAVPVEELPVQTKEDSSISIGTRQIGSDSARFSRCARMPRSEMLEAILDGKPNGSRSEGALHDYVIRNLACLKHVPRPLPERAYYGVCNPEISSDLFSPCRTIFDRGYLFEKVSKEYGSEVWLTAASLSQAGVLDRFLSREDERNATRRKSETQFYFAVACMVRINPAYAVRLLDFEAGSEGETEMRQRLIGNGQRCVGGAENITVDSDQFRSFTAEAVYGWTVAISGQDTLVPEQS